MDKAEKQDFTNFNTHLSSPIGSAFKLFVSFKAFKKSRQDKPYLVY